MPCFQRHIFVSTCFEGIKLCAYDWKQKGSTVHACNLVDFHWYMWVFFNMRLLEVIFVVRDFCFVLWTKWSVRSFKICKTCDIFMKTERCSYGCDLVLVLLLAHWNYPDLDLFDRNVYLVIFFSQIFQHRNQTFFVP